MDSISKKLNYFFQEHHDQLQKNYPGLTCDHLINRFCDFYDQSKDDWMATTLERFCELLLRAMPLEYIFKQSFFYNHLFYVDERVLIPRSETEILVEKSLEWIKRSPLQRPRLYEVGVGSGAISLSLAANSDKALEIQASDIDLDALEVAKINAFRLRYALNPSTSIKFESGDRLSMAMGEYDLILSNPPYIKEREHRKGVHAQVECYEPHVALYLKDSEYNHWFKIFFEQVRQHLATGGFFIMEGHEDSLDELLEIASKSFNNVKIVKDYADRKRFLECY